MRDLPRPSRRNHQRGGPGSSPWASDRLRRRANKKSAGVPLPVECLHSMRGRNIFAQPRTGGKAHRALFSGCVTEFSTHTAAFDEEVPFCLSVICHTGYLLAACRCPSAWRMPACEGVVPVKKAEREVAAQCRPAQTKRETPRFFRQMPGRRFETWSVSNGKCLWRKRLFRRGALPLPVPRDVPKRKGTHAMNVSAVFFWCARQESNLRPTA